MILPAPMTSSLFSLLLTETPTKTGRLSLPDKPALSKSARSSLLALAKSEIKPNPSLIGKSGHKMTQKTNEMDGGIGYSASTEMIS